MAQLWWRRRVCKSLLNCQEGSVSALQVSACNVKHNSFKLVWTVLFPEQDELLPATLAGVETIRNLQSFAKPKILVPLLTCDIFRSVHLLLWVSADSSIFRNTKRRVLRHKPFDHVGSHSKVQNQITPLLQTGRGIFFSTLVASDIQSCRLALFWWSWLWKSHRWLCLNTSRWSDDSDAGNLDLFNGQEQFRTYSLPTNDHRVGHTATEIADGVVLIIGKNPVDRYRT